MTSNEVAAKPLVFLSQTGVILSVVLITSILEISIREVS